jgi:hypothetical protein
MPIVSISKIQHRYGLSDNGPSNSDNLQLSAAELGWELDTRRLFIGNGPISEGAPEIGNTEILTEHTNIIAIDDLYSYEAEHIGYNHETVKRTLQSKLDEYVSVRDYGAVGNGVTDDTAAINLALSDLFTDENQNASIRRTLFFPAGVYLTTGTIKIPPYAKLVGEGKDSSVIMYEDSDTSIITAIVVDSKGQSDSDIGNNGARQPANIEINDMSFERNTDGIVFKITNSKNCVFRRVGFIGNAESAPGIVGTHGSCVEITKISALETSNIVFENCDFKENAFGTKIGNDIQNVLFNACYFKTLHNGAKVDNTSGSATRAINITNSYFDDIYDSAIHVSNVPGVNSAYNYFGNEVGNNSQGSGSPTVEVIKFESNGNTSIGDVFERNDTDAATYARVSYNTETYSVNASDGAYFGYHKTEAGRVATLTAGSTDASTGLTFDSTDEMSTLIYYTATKGEHQRQGTLRITGANITDEYNETSDLKLSFAAVDDSTNITLNYTLDAGTDVTFKYSVQRML